MAQDGIHPSSHGYALWAEGLSELILAAGYWQQVREHHLPRQNSKWQARALGERRPFGLRCSD
jgi:hypothetical protein